MSPRNMSAVQCVMARSRPGETFTDVSAMSRLSPQLFLRWATRMVLRWRESCAMLGVGGRPVTKTPKAGRHPKRPHIPLGVRVQVARRQIIQKLDVSDSWALMDRTRECSQTSKLAEFLKALFGDEPHHLDHEPALALRRRTRSGRYIPDANDPGCLLYRTRHGHHIKTNVAGDHGARSDTAERVHQRRLARNRANRAAPKRRRKRTSRPIPSRVNPWPLGRKFRSRR